MNPMDLWRILNLVMLWKHRWDLHSLVGKMLPTLRPSLFSFQSSWSKDKEMSVSIIQFAIVFMCNSFISHTPCNYTFSCSTFAALLKIKYLNLKQHWATDTIHCSTKKWSFWQWNWTACFMLKTNLQINTCSVRDVTKLIRFWQFDWF